MEYYIANTLDKLYIISGIIFGISAMVAFVIGLSIDDSLTEQDQERFRKSK